MRLREFIRQNRKELDEFIRRQYLTTPRLNDKEREAWVLNDESLYRWAQREGVPI